MTHDFLRYINIITYSLTYDNSRYRGSIVARGKNGSRDLDHAHHGVVCYPKANTLGNLIL